VVDVLMRRGYRIGCVVGNLPGPAVPIWIALAVWASPTARSLRHIKSTSSGFAWAGSFLLHHRQAPTGSSPLFVPTTIE
jgi:hypothetical protein